MGRRGIHQNGQEQRKPVWNCFFCQLPTRLNTTLNVTLLKEEKNTLRVLRDQHQQNFKTCELTFRPFSNFKVKWFHNLAEKNDTKTWTEFRHAKAPMLIPPPRLYEHPSLFR